MSVNMKELHFNTLILLILSSSLWMTSCSDEPATVEELRSEITSILDDEPGTYAIFFKDLKDESRQITINPDTVFHAASTMKTPVMIEVFKQAEEDRFSIDDSIRIENTFYSIVDSSEFSLELDPNADDPFERKVGEMATIYDLTHAMITYSSNIATNLMIQLVGAENTTETMRELGAENINVLRGVYDMKAYERGLSNRTTARDLAVILERIAEGEAVNEEASRQMIEIMKEQFYKDIIGGNLPEDAVVASKSGFITGVRHDSGIVSLPGGQSYILVYLSKNVPDEERSVEVGAEISRIIYDFTKQNAG
jgi:beta-lactamase class A